MNISNNAIQLIAKWEGFRANAYKDIAGVVTIGYGTTKWENGKSVQMGEVVSHERALALLKLQVQQHASTITHYVKRSLTQNQYDALASFQYNLGKHILAGNATLLNALNKGDWTTVTSQMMLYNKARVGGKLTPVKGLTNRRTEEVALFKKGLTVVQASKPVTQTAANTNSIVDYLKARKMESSFAARVKLAGRYGIKNYTGTVSQNTQLIKLLQTKSS